MTYWINAEQLKLITDHLRAWNNKILSIEVDNPDLFLITMEKEISEDEIKCLKISKVI